MAVIDNLVSYWSLDEASGNALDAHGTNDLTDHNSVGSGTGKVSGARDFEADSTQYFSHTDNSDLSLGIDTDFTWILWCKNETIQIGSGAPLIVKGGGGTTGEYMLWFKGSGEFELSVGNGSSTGIVQTTGAVQDDTGIWHQIACWHDSAADQLAIQIDNGTPVTASWSGGTQDGTAPVQIGYDGAFWTVGKYDGLVDELSLWKRTLTTDERTWLYNSGNGRSYADIVAEAGGGATGKPSGYYARQRGA